MFSWISNQMLDALEAGSSASVPRWPVHRGDSALGEGEPVEHVFAVLRERLYGAISCLATLAVLARYTTETTSAWARLLDVAVATGGLWAASLFADFVAHLGVYGGRPHRREVAAMLQASGQILQAAVIPAGVLTAAALGLLKTPPRCGSRCGRWSASSR